MMRFPCQQTYALRLERRNDGTLAGELEHVLSGERRSFGNDVELLAALRQLSPVGDPAPPAPATR